MKNFKFLFFIFSLIVCDDQLTTVEHQIIFPNETIKNACENIQNPTSKNDCVIATLEWDFRCCYIYINEGENKKKGKCKYIQDNIKAIKAEAKSLKQDNSKYKINCEGNFLTKNVYLSFFILLLIL